jgi:hypothetical protein
MLYGVDNSAVRLPRRNGSDWPRLLISPHAEQAGGGGGARERTVRRQLEDRIGNAPISSARMTSRQRLPSGPDRRSRPIRWTADPDAGVREDAGSVRRCLRIARCSKGPLLSGHNRVRSDVYQDTGRVEQHPSRLVMTGLCASSHRHGIGLPEPTGYHQLRLP